jgi:hypothetical protein
MKKGMLTYPHMPPRNNDPEGNEYYVNSRIDQLTDESLIINQTHKKDYSHDAYDIPGQDA